MYKDENSKKINDAEGITLRRPTGSSFRASRDTEIYFL
jgi:hypothetical protein